MIEKNAEYIVAAREGLQRCLNAHQTINTNQKTQSLTLKKQSVQKPTTIESRKRSQSIQKTATEAVERLRAKDRAQQSEEDQRIYYIDKVDSLINQWKSGKENNLRGLLCGLQEVLWEEVGWVKVELGDLITTNQVKVRYMKAIGRVHPDKVGEVGVERKMISSAVFSILNAGWDSFKAQNGLK